MSCAFCDRVKSGRVDLVLEDVVMFAPWAKQTRNHWLLVTKRHLPSFASLDTEELPYLGSLLHSVLEAVKHLKLERYRVQINGPGFAHVPHLHVHLLGA